MSQLANKQAPLASDLGRVALVTGAAMGIGAAIAERLGRDGHTVVVADINLAAAEEMVAGLNAQGIEALALAIDVGDGQSIAAAFAYLQEHFGRCDVLVNNAGIARTQAFLDCDLGDWQRVLNINLTGSLLCGQHAARLMSANGWGRIINVASISGMRASMGRTAYGTSKAAIIGLTRQMAVELAEYGITVNGIAPGPVDTPLTQMLHSATTRDSYARAVPMRRYGTPAEMAGAVAFLASDDSSYISGHVIPVDGGFMASGILEI
ncbi:SDR family NAD(P)-dependent oxidoreductase [Pseudomonas sp. R5(2019)]|uniref:SDR family NAD(P)-dependent oxidoreductase n=1 Tax=Pseudomonas sp. R5(2019) TaxID=2697566 RepID=UPI00141304F9|nr:SDR family NAD(P)-dependent oxidoreductase [Pseudomonas sp. R5(2019)]NBA97624.1 glucose 1-dehydrogenase [Pseudomonas sp. R5(2019)]